MFNVLKYVLLNIQWHYRSLCCAVSFSALLLWVWLIKRMLVVMCRHVPGLTGEDEYSHYCCKEFHSLTDGMFHSWSCFCECGHACSVFKALSPLFSARETFNGLLTLFPMKLNHVTEKIHLEKVSKVSKIL